MSTPSFTASSLRFSIKLGNKIDQSDGRNTVAFVPVYANESGGIQKSSGRSTLGSLVSEDLLKRVVQSKSFQPTAKQLQFIRYWDQGTESLLLAGMGESKSLTVEKVRQTAALAYSKASAEKQEQIWVVVDAQGLSVEDWVRGVAEGLLLASYRYTKHKSKKSKSDAEYSGPTEVIFFCRDGVNKAVVNRELERAKQVAEAMWITRDWSNEPSNTGTPTYYADAAKALAKKFGLKCTVLGERECARERMGLFLGVGQGSEQENKFVIVEYKPKKPTKNMKTIALVGKGVTFDTGGISIKPAANMEDMKHDMTGAATMMGAVVLASMWQAPNRVVAYLAFTENMPDGRAINPGNVIRARSGKTVEVINTDAEGRLILADALDYAQDQKPDVVIDAATLTGAVGIALGKHCCAILGNQPELIDTLRSIGEKQHERMWELPLYDEYFEDLKSDYADMKNVGPNGLGGTIRGAIFLKQFIRPKTVWAHLDIAYTAYDVGHLPYNPKRGATGAHVRTLAQFAMEY